MFQNGFPKPLAVRSNMPELPLPLKIFSWHREEIFTSGA
jgi:hypothetical protein